MPDEQILEKPARTQSTGARTGDTVTVGCKYPSGLILRLYDMVEGDLVPIMGGGYKRETIARARPEQVTLNGYAMDVDALAAGNTPDYPIVRGYAITSHVPKDFMDEWFKQNKDTKLVQNHIVFIARDDRSAFDMAKEREKVRNGLEPIDPANPTERVPDLKGKIKGYVADDEKAA